MAHFCRELYYSTVTMTKTGEKEHKPVLLIFPFGLLSHYLRCLTLAKYLRKDFHILFAYDEKFIDFIAREDFQTFSCLALNADAVLQSVKNFDFSWINERSLEPVYLDQVRVISLLNPAAVLGDTSPTLKMAAEKTGVMYVSLMNGYMSKYYSISRKMSRTHPLSKFLKYVPVYIVDALTQKGEALTFFSVHNTFKKIRRKHLLSFKKYYLDELEGDLNLVCDLQDLFPQRDLPSNYRQIAPLYYDSDDASGAVTDKLDSNKKTIFVSMGSSGDWEKVGFLNDPGFGIYNIITAADKDNILHAGHIIKMRFVYVHELFPATDLVICHGGNGTIYQALLYGIPLLCSTSHFEQEWNVDALERLNIGKSLDGIKNHGDYLQIVAEWLDKKEKGSYAVYQNKITSQVQELHTVAGHITAEILEPHAL